jgi:tyrosyl-tRNA synthetase
MFTELPLEEIARLEALRDADINEAKKILANEATRLCHGAEAASVALDTATRVFSGATADGLPTFPLKAGTVAQVTEIVVALGLAGSRSEARRLIEQGGVRLNDAVVRSATASVAESDLDSGGAARLSVGKKRHGLIRRA